METRIEQFVMAYGVERDNCGCFSAPERAIRCAPQKPSRRTRSSATVNLPGPSAQATLRICKGAIYDDIQKRKLLEMLL